MTRRSGGRLTLGLMACLWCAATMSGLAQTAASATLPSIVIDDSTAVPVEQTLDRAGALPFTVGARVTASSQERLDRLTARNIPLWLVVTSPDRLEDMEPWRRDVQALLARYGAHVVALEVRVGSQPVELAGFAVRTAAIEARAVTTGTVRVVVGGQRMQTDASRADLYTADLAPYIDILSVPAAQADDAAAWLVGIDPTARIAAELDGAAARPSRQIAATVMRTAGSTVDTTILPASPDLAPALKALAPVTEILSPNVARMDDTGSDLRMSANGRDVAGTISHRLLFDDRTFATYLAFPEGTGAGIDVSVRLTSDARPVVYDLGLGDRRDANAVTWDAATRVVRLRLAPSAGPLFVDFNRDAADVVGDRAVVVGQRGLSIAEIIARHQAVQRRQDLRVLNYVANADTAQHFRPSMADPGYDVASENRYFVSGDDIEWEELSFSVNGTHWGADRPPFPLLQPEKVLSLPLQLRFDNGYRYSLNGEARVNGYDCYVVHFEPVRSDVALYRGTVWIDRRSFARIRVQALQGGLPAPVVSNEETLDYAPPITVDSQPVFLLYRLSSRQIMLIAGRNILVEKQVQFHEVRVNDANFEAERAAARSGDRIMFRETDAGLRYYVKQGDARIISEHPTQSAKALAMGINVDPSYAYPLPIVGINYLDFAFGGPNSQLALLFGGVLAAGNIQRPKLGRTPFDASVDFFAIAVPSSDWLFTATGEQAPDRVRTWPLSTGLNLGWQYTPYQKVLAQYQLRYDAYAHDTTTASDFTLPVSTVTNGLGLSWEYKRAGFVVNAADTEFRRATWQAWGAGVDPANPGPPQGQSYARHSVSVSRDFHFKLFQTIHLNGAYFGGRDLDRFSKYQFGMFDDTRIHGVPESGVRYGQLGVARGSYSLNIFDLYRLDLFAEQAWGRDTPAPWERLTGMGLAVSLRAPKGTILRADFGRSLLPDRLKGAGSYTLQVLVLKPLR